MTGRRREPSPLAGAPENLPAVVAEVRAAFEAYERDLAANDVEALDGWFHRDAVRYGVADIEYGIDEIAAWRASAPGVPPGRRVGPTVIATFGTDFAHVGTEFRHPGGERVGRQSQTWVRTGAGWRIVAAHVSEIPAELLRR